MFYELIEQYYPDESCTYVIKLFDKSAEEVCSLYRELTHIGSIKCDRPNIKKLVKELCDRNEGLIDKLSRELFMWFYEKYMS